MGDFKKEVEKAGSIKNYWTNTAKKNLVGATIVRVEYMPQDELDEMMWYKAPLCILMQKGKTRFWIYPSMDDEGNDGGALFTTIKEYSCAPTL
jgi:hypothetical protein|tara:strand:- start:752 stop:1030 length:279 start_codon:yes stop_codon:yes gene_type:complete